MRIKTGSGNFQPCPEYNGSAVCVDVTPLKTVQTQFGPKDKFRFVYETGQTKDDGTPWCVWSAPFTPSYHENSALRPFLRKWLGRELTLQEFNAEFGPAVKSVLPTDTVFGRAIEREIDVDASGDAGHAAALEALKKQHADEIAAIQAGVNAFTEQANRDIAAANECMKQQAARIEELGGMQPQQEPEAAPESTPVEEPEVVPTTEDKPKGAKKKKK